MANASQEAVSVRSADGDLSHVQPDGGVLVLSDHCLPAPVVVTYAAGEQISVDAPVCPGQELRISDSAVEIIERSHR